MNKKQQDMPPLHPSNVEGDKGVIKYVRKDVFIEKAAEWLAGHVTCDGYTFQSKAKMIREFKKAMDYEKNNEAIDIVKRMVADGQVSQEVAEKYFHELAESEDERVRKKVIDVLKLNVRGAESQMQASRGVDRTFEVYACNKVIAWLEKQGEQKPAWSEEDETIITEIINDIECAKAVNYHAPKENYEFRQNWLKDLKDRVQPQTTWKPSDEQLDALETAAASLQSNALVSLHSKLINL